MNTPEKGKAMDNNKKYLSLDDILADEEFHIIAEPNKSSNYSVRNEEGRLVASFQEINDFYEKNKRAPLRTKGILEFELCIVLETIQFVIS